MPSFGTSDEDYRPQNAARVLEKRQYSDAEQPLKAWFHEASKADWDSPAAIKMAYRSASVVADNRIVFDIAGNKYRLVVKVNYPYKTIYLRFVGTHAAYDAIDVTAV
jgi:mRNA interferase HigB